MVSGFETPIQFTYHPSVFLGAVETLMAAGACAGVLLAAMPMVVKLGSLALITLSTGCALRALGFSRAPEILRLSPDGRWLCEDPDGQIRQLALCNPVFVHTCLIVLRFRDRNRRRRVFLLCPDNLDPRLLRRLRVRLRFPVA